MAIDSTAPFEQYLANYGFSTEPRSRRRRQPPQQPQPVTPEEEQGALGKVIGGLAAVGSALDLPWSSVRDAMVGANPLDQWANPFTFDEKTRTSGRKLLEHMGVASRNKPGWNWGDWGDMAGDVGGFAVEALDPITAGITGPLGTLSRGSAAVGKAAKAAGSTLKVLDKAEDAAEAAGLAQKLIAKVPGKAALEATDYMPGTAAAFIDQVRKGQRGLLGYRLPFSDQQVVSLGKGEGVANVLQKLTYGGGPVSDQISRIPRALTSMFSPYAKGAFSGAEQLQHSLAAGQQMIEWAAVQDAIPSMMHQYNRLSGELEKVMGHYQSAGDPKSANALMTVIAEMRGNFGRGVEKLTGNARDEALYYTKRAVQEFAPGLQGAQLDNMTSALYDFEEGLSLLKNQAWENWRKLGGSAKDFDDFFAGHFPRRGTQHLDIADPTGRRKEVLRTIPLATVGLNTLGMDPTITAFYKLASDEKVLAAETMRAALGPAAKDLGLKEVQRAYLAKRLTDLAERHFRISELPMSMKVGDEMVTFANADDYLGFMTQEYERTFFHKGKKRVKKTNRLEELRRYLTTRPKEVLEEGLYNRSVYQSELEYLEGMVAREANLRAVHRMLNLDDVLQPADKAGYKPLVKAWTDAGLQEEGLATLAEDMALNKKMVGGRFIQTVEDLNQYAVHPDVAKSMKAYKRVGEKKTTQEVTRWWDKILSTYRGLLVMAPSFHVRNQFGGIFQEMTDDKLPLTAILRGKAAAYAHVQSGGAKPLEYIDEIKEFDLLGSSSRIAEWLSKQAAEKASRIPESLGDVFIEPFANGKWKQAKTYNPLGVRGVVGEGSESGLAKVQEKVYNLVEFSNRAGYYNELRKAGYSPAQSLQYVKRAHFDYGNLSNFEQTFAKRMFTFWSWKRHSIPYTLQKLAERPGGRTGVAFKGLGQFQRSDEDTYVPSFLREKLGIPLGRTPEGETTFLTQLGLPIEDINQFAWRDSLGETAKRWGQRQASEMAPLLTGLVEGLTGTHLYTGRPKKYIDSRTERWFGTQVPWLDSVIALQPFSRQVSEAEKLADPRKDAGLKALGGLTGVKTATYDTEKWKTIDVMEGMRRDAERTPDVAEFTRLYVPKAKREEVPPDLLTQIARIQELQNILADQANQKKEMTKMNKRK